MWEPDEEAEGEPKFYWEEDDDDHAPWRSHGSGFDSEEVSQVETDRHLIQRFIDDDLDPRELLFFDQRIRRDHAFRDRAAAMLVIRATPVHEMRRFLDRTLADRHLAAFRRNRLLGTDSGATRITPTPAVTPEPKGPRTRWWRIPPLWVVALTPLVGFAIWWGIAWLRLPPAPMVLRTPDGNIFEIRGTSISVMDGETLTVRGAFTVHIDSASALSYDRVVLDSGARTDGPRVRHGFMMAGSATVDVATAEDEELVIRLSASGSLRATRAKFRIIGKRPCPYRVEVSEGLVEVVGVEVKDPMVLGKGEGVTVECEAAYRGA